MDGLTLKDGFFLRMEPHNDMVRLVIVRGEEEYVCRMETLKKLKEFTEIKDGRIFKGRLQLYKEEGLINVIAKGQAAGIIDETSFINCLEAIEW